jgi:hypothetical protein
MYELLRSNAVAAMLLTAAFACSLFAQQITGSITGSVLDTSGAGIPGVEVRLTNTGTGATSVAQSDGVANFQFLLLPPGTYLVEASHPGFKLFRRDGIVVVADRSLAIPVTLNVGDATETVEIIESTPLLDPNSSELGTTIDSQKMVDLPLNSRNPMGLANLIPTVKGVGFFGGQVLTSWRVGAVNIGGAQPMTSAFLMDGVANDKLGDAAGPMTFLTTDSTQEFKVITNSASAEYGRTTGGIISVVSKSGSNSLHGSAFEYLQNTVFNANDFFSNASGTPLPPVHQNQFGGSLGGKIKKDRTFFFGNFEGLIQHLSSSRIINSPTALQRTGDFSKTFAANGQLIVIYDPLSTAPNPNSPGAFIRTPFTNNSIPESRISKFAKGFFALYPLPNLPGAPVTGANNLFQSGAIPTDRQTGGVKVDHSFNSNQRLAVRYTRDVLNETVPNGSYFQNVLDNDKKTIYVPRHSASLSYTNTLSPTIILDARSGFNRDYDQATPWSYDGKYAQTGYPLTDLGIPQSLINQLQTGTLQFPGLTVTDLTTYGSAIQNRAAYTWGNGASLTKVWSAHTVKAGYQYTLYRGFPFDRSPLNFTFNRGFTQGPNPTTASATSGYGTASLILGMPASGNAVYQPVHEQQELDHALYVQDDWKFSRKLSLNLGLRWERQGAFTDRFNQMTNFDPTASSTVKGVTLRGGTIFPGVNGVPRTVAEESNLHYMPRVGFAYQLREKLVARGGYGLFFVPEKGILNPASTGFGITTPMVTSLDNGLHVANTIDNPFPDGILFPTGAKDGLLTGLGTSISGQLRDVRQGYAQQWNFTLQFAPRDNWLVEGAYLGNKGTNLQTLQARNLDQLDPQYLSLGNALNATVPNPYQGIIQSGQLGGPTITRQQSLLPYPQYTGVTGGWAYLGSSIYHAFALKVERHYSQGLSILASYTISKMIDAATGSGGAVRTGGTPETGIVNWYNLGAERSKSIYDIPQRAVITTVWEEPFFKNSGGWKRQVLAGWNFNGILTMQSGATIALMSGSSTQRPNVVAGVSAVPDHQTLDQWINKGAYSIPAPFTYGNSSRTIPNLMSDGLVDLDFSLYKDFTLRERARIQLKGEAYNLTNTPTFDVPNRDINAQNFGTVTSTALNPRPRSIQLSLRLTF